MDSRVASWQCFNFLSREIAGAKEKWQARELRESMRFKLYASCAFENLDGFIFDYYTFDYRILLKSLLFRVKNLFFITRILV